MTEDDQPAEPRSRNGFDHRVPESAMQAQGPTSLWGGVARKP